MASSSDPSNPRFPLAAGILLGLGLGGFFDGIVLHQILQWHHMVSSAGYPPDSVANLEFNTLLDGLFHATTYLFVVAGIVMLWRTQWIYWDIGFLVWGVVMILIGIRLVRRDRQRQGVATG